MVSTVEIRNIISTHELHTIPSEIVMQLLDNIDMMQELVELKQKHIDVLETILKNNKVREGGSDE